MVLRVRWAENRFGHAMEARKCSCVSCLYGRGHFVGKTGKIARTRHFRAKSVCYIPRFWGLARGSGVLWVENQPRHDSKAREHPSIVCLCGQGHLVGQAGEMALIGHFGPNRCAIAHDSGGGLEVQGCCGPKIDLGMLGRLGSILVFPVCVEGAIWLVKRAKRREWGVLGPNQCAIAHGSKDPFGWLYRRNGTNGAFWGQIGMLYPTVSRVSQGIWGSGVPWAKTDIGLPGRLGSILVFPIFVGGAIWLIKRENGGNEAFWGKFGSYSLWFWVRPMIRRWCGMKIDLGHAKEAGERPSFACLCGWGHLGRGYLVGQTGETVRMRLFGAKSMFYILRFWGWGWYSGVPWVKNRPGHAREARKNPSIACLYGRGHLVVQMGETPRTGHFGAKSVCYSPPFRGCHGLKIDLGMPERLGSVLVFPVCAGGSIWDIWLVRRKKRRERGILEPIQCAIAHSSTMGPGSRVAVGRKSTWACKQGKQRERGILGPNQCAITHDFRGGIGVQGYHRPKINLGVPSRPGSILVLPICMGRPIWEAGEHPSVFHLCGRGHLVGQTGKMVLTEHFGAVFCSLSWYYCTVFVVLVVMLVVLVVVVVELVKFMVAIGGGGGAFVGGIYGGWWWCRIKYLGDDKDSKDGGKKSMKSGSTIVVVHPWIVPTEQELGMTSFITLGFVDTLADPTVDLIKKELAGAIAIRRAVRQDEPNVEALHDQPTATDLCASSRGVAGEVVDIGGKHIDATKSRDNEYVDAQEKIIMFENTPFTGLSHTYTGSSHPYTVPLTTLHLHVLISGVKPSKKVREPYTLTVAIGRKKRVINQLLFYWKSKKITTPPSPKVIEVQGPLKKVDIFKELSAKEKNDLRWAKNAKKGTQDYPFHTFASQDFKSMKDMRTYYMDKVSLLFLT
ncbi:hypothetical protein FXO37_07155 [Capsicum annuum]|nr:hypothetical protein FXO37_07155 [Capsicum annuum]